MRKLVIFLSLVAVFLSPIRVFAGTTGWLDLSKQRAVNAALSAATKNMGEYEYFKSIKCKAENGRIFMKVNYNVIMSGGFYGVTYGTKEKIDEYFSHPDRKRLKTRIRSRSDVKTKNGIFSCVVWFRPL